MSKLLKRKLELCGEWNMSDCTYCGSIYGNHMDHVIPKSYTANDSFDRKYVVPACAECNCTLSDNLLFTIPERAGFLYDRYLIKYKRELNSKLWSEKDLGELGYALQSHVRIGNEQTLLIRNRVQNLKILSEQDDIKIKDVWNKKPEVKRILTRSVKTSMILSESEHNAPWEKELKMKNYTEYTNEINDIIQCYKCDRKTARLMIKYKNEYVKTQTPIIHETISISISAYHAKVKEIKELNNCTTPEARKLYKDLK